MQRQWIFLACMVSLAAGIAIGFLAGGAFQQEADRDTLYQMGTIDALLQGAYDGFIPFREVKKHGDFGIATLDGLDGEMIAFGGRFYQITSNGSVIEVTDDMTTPFGSVTYFSPDSTFFIASATNFSDFSRQAEQYLPSKNLMYAVQIRGEFPYIKARSIPRQEKPYPRLIDATANQSVFEFRDTAGTVAGFWTPDLAKGLNIPGFHLHYLTEDSNAGGHILDFVLENATVEIDTTTGFAMELPEGESFSTVDLSGDLSADLAVVEQGRS